MKHLVIGTAGHIDHGKTTLIKQLTGIDTDRLAEEKQRGITIELGFTHMDLPSGNRIGIVDVPGHEKFIRQMVAGVVGMDMVLLIVAADEGIMPQTREHIDILSQLGVKQSIIVITKCDLVDQEWLELVEEEVRKEVMGTFLELAPIIPVSAIRKDTLQPLIEAMDSMTLSEVVERNRHTITRLPIDRVFTMRGIGTVVTGTLISGQIQQDMWLQLYPKNLLCKVRGIQVYGQTQTDCYAGQRVALQLASCKKEDIQRGDVLAPQGSLYRTQVIDTSIQLLPHTTRMLTQRNRIHFHIGTSEVIGRVRMLEQEVLHPGEQGLVQIYLESPVTVQRGDRFVIRFYSPIETIGGGVVLAPNAVKHKFQQPEVIQQLQRLQVGTPEDALELVLHSTAETLCECKELAQRMGLSSEEVTPILESLEKQGRIYRYHTMQGSYVWHIQDYRERISCMQDGLRKFHHLHPYAIGMRKSNFVLEFRKHISSPVFELFVGQCLGEGYIKQQYEYLYLSEFIIRKDQQYMQLQEQISSMLKMANTAWLTQEEIYENQKNRVYLADIMQTLEVEGVIMKLTNEAGRIYYTLRTIVDPIIKWVIQELQEKKVLTLIEIKDKLQSSRKNVKILLEYLDKEKITAKVGGESQRVLGKDWNIYLDNSL